ncbi:unnamed protein product [Pseudo-nitzschia multistriata]|uniref:Uncharacterized protein n=1 Tax=Pseudo-nitzschia multistriata TaxID=183589 RepID=A0A448YUR5_9STRA|nr:unnamed protein product [Pseudo-nitzschia multistriata]
MSTDPEDRMNTQEDREARDGLLQLNTYLGGHADGLVSDDSSEEDFHQEEAVVPPPPPAAQPPVPPAPPTLPAASHPLFKTAQATLAKRKFVPLKEKQDLLLRIREKLSHDLIKAVFPGGDALSLEMQGVYHNITATGNTHHKRRLEWSQAFTATMLAKFFTGMEIRKGRSDQQQKRESRRTAAAVAELETVSRAVKKAMKAEETSNRLKGSKHKKGKVYWQQGAASRLQDQCSYDPAKLDRFGCPICDHHSIMPVDDLDKIQKHNQGKRKEHDIAVAEHDAANRDKKGHPKLKGMLDVRMACYCCKFNCKLDPRGGTCPECSKPGVDYLEYENGVPVACNCPLCNCQCSIYFYLTDRFNINKNEERLRSGPQPEEEQYSGNPIFARSSTCRRP